MGNLAPHSSIPAISQTNIASSTAAVMPNRPSRQARLVSIIAVTLALLIPAAAAAAEPETTLARFAGSWRWIGGPGELRALDDAIEVCVKQMNLFIRPIARHRIRKPLQPSPEIVLSIVPGPSLSISRPDRPTIAIPTSGQQVRWRDPGGDWFLMSLGVDNGVLQQRFEGTSSISFNSYILDPTGYYLTVHTRIVSKRLPAPIEFDTTYQKNS